MAAEPDKPTVEVDQPADEEAPRKKKRAGLIVAIVAVVFIGALVVDVTQNPEMLTRPFGKTNTLDTLESFQSEGYILLDGSGDIEQQMRTMEQVAEFSRPKFSDTLPTGDQSLAASTEAWESDEHGWWHAHLNDRQKLLYDRMYPHLEAHDASCELASFEELFSDITEVQYFTNRESPEPIEAKESLENDLNAATDAIRHDHPELFWFMSRGGYSLSGTQGAVILSLPEIHYCYTTEEIEELQPQIDAAVEEALAAASDETTDYEKAAAVYEWLIDNLEYNREQREAGKSAEDGEEVDGPLQDGGQTIVSALVDRSTVCAGYASAYQLILSKLGIPCTRVGGTAKGLYDDEGVNHAWNLVCLGGKYGYVDATWADMTSGLEPVSALTVKEAAGAYWDVSGIVIDEEESAGGEAEGEIPLADWQYFFMTDADSEYDGRSLGREEFNMSVEYPTCDTNIWADDRFVPDSSHKLELHFAWVDNESGDVVIQEVSMSDGPRSTDGRDYYSLLKYILDEDESDGEESSDASATIDNEDFTFSIEGVILEGNDLYVLYDFVNKTSVVMNLTFAETLTVNGREMPVEYQSCSHPEYERNKGGCMLKGAGDVIESTDDVTISGTFEIDDFNSEPTTYDFEYTSTP